MQRSRCGGSILPTVRTNTLRTLWDQDKAATGLWISTPNSVGAERLGALGADYIVVDLQHGLLDYRDALAILAAMQGSSSVPLVRVGWNSPSEIGKVLDAGAMGVIVPMVNTAEQARAAVGACRYAPDGERSFGPARAASALGPEYFPEANTEILCIPMIETTEAVANLEAILEVPGIDAIYVGPADLSLTLGLPPAGDHDNTGFQAVLDSIVARCAHAGTPAGIHANPSIATKRLKQGFTMVTVTTDLLAMLAGASAALAEVESA